MKKGNKMRLGEIGLLTNDAVKLVGFYKILLVVNNGSNDYLYYFYCR